jgi:hypothetical protein
VEGDGSCGPNTYTAPLLLDWKADTTTVAPVPSVATAEPKPSRAVPARLRLGVEEKLKAKAVVASGRLSTYTMPCLLLEVAAITATRPLPDRLMAAPKPELATPSVRTVLLHEPWAAGAMHNS